MGLVKDVVAKFHQEGTVIGMILQIKTDLLQNYFLDSKSVLQCQFQT